MNRDDRQSAWCAPRPRWRPRRRATPRGSRHRPAPDADGGAAERRPVRRVGLRHRPRPAARPLRGHGGHPPHRRGGHRSPASGRARPLAAAARPGGLPDRLRTRAALRRLRLLQLPRARRRLLPWRRTRRSAARVARHGAERLEPVRHQHGDPAGHHRRPDAARDGIRARHPGRRHRRRRGRLLRRRRDQRGRRERGPDLRRDLRRPGRVLLSEQPVRDLRAGRAAGAAADRRARPGVRRAEHPRRRQRRARGARGLPRRPRPRPLGRRSDVHRGRHLPDGPAHHGGRPHPLPRPVRAGRVARP